MCDFESLVSDVGNAIDKTVIPYSNAFEWSEFGDCGNACYNPFDDLNNDEWFRECLYIGAVRAAMRKGGDRHRNLSHAVVKQLSVSFVSYDWLVKATGRLLAGVDNFDELQGMAQLAYHVKRFMHEHEIGELNSEVMEEFRTWASGQPDLIDL